MKTGFAERAIPVSNEELMKSFRADLARGFRVRFRPKGRSMCPFIDREKGDIVEIAAPQGCMRRGMIVLAQIGDRYFLHRIICVEGNSITLQGDGNVGMVEKCTVSDVMAVVTACFRDGRPRKVFGFQVNLWIRLHFIRRYLLAALRIAEKFR